MRIIALLIFSLSISSSCKSKTNQEINNKLIVENIEARKLAANHWQTYTDIVIDAPIEKVWSILTDWSNLSSWSSSFIGITGDIQNNGNVFISYLVDGKKYDTPHIFVYKEMEEFGWSDSMEGSFEGLTDNHRFRVEKISDKQTRFIQSDDFRGIGNQNMTAENVANITVQFFPIFNRELKNKAEK
jgi:hypothetical protein